MKHCNLECPFCAKDPADDKELLQADNWTQDPSIRLLCRHVPDSKDPHVRLHNTDTYERFAGWNNECMYGLE